MTALLVLLAAALAQVDRSGPPAVPPPEPPVFAAPAVFSLADGTEVWIVERHGLPLVRVELSLGLGYLSSPNPEAARLLGALLPLGTAAHPGVAWADALADLGATGRLGVGAMRTWADVETVVGHEAEALALLSEALRTPALARRDLRRVRRAWVDGQRKAPANGAQVQEAAVARTVYGADHLLGRVATARDYRRLRHRDLQEAHGAILANGRPSILVVGDTTPEVILPLLEAAWAGFAGGGAPSEVPPPGPPLAHVVLVDLPGAPLANLAVSLPAPGAFTEDLAAAELANEVLGGTFTSRLNQNLRERRGLTYGVDSRIRAWPGHGRLQVELAVDPADVGAALDEVRRELDRLVDEPPDAAEIASARRAMYVRGARALGSMASLAYRYGVQQAYGQPPDGEARTIDRYAALDAEQVRAAAVALGTAERVWIVTGDRPTLEPTLEAAGWFPDAVRSAGSLFEDGRRPRGCRLR